MIVPVCRCAGNFEIFGRGRDPELESRHLAGYFLAVPAALFGFFKVVYEVGTNRKQRADERRWRQANAAKELLDDIHTDELAKNAIHMLDWVDGVAACTIQGQSEVIGYPDVLTALAMNRREG